jgi:hypothetical protein
LLAAVTEAGGKAVMIRSRSRRQRRRSISLKTDLSGVQMGKKSLGGGIVGCTGAVVIASETDPQAALVLKLRTEAGGEVLLPLSERSAKQVQMVIGKFNRSRDFLVVEGRRAAAATLQ